MKTLLIAMDTVTVPCCPRKITRDHIGPEPGSPAGGVGAGREDASRASGQALRGVMGSVYAQLPFAGDLR